jgi:hypothetical protein
LCEVRAGLLPNSAAIIGQRFRVVGGGSSTNNEIFPGTQTVLSDLPSLALLCTIQASGAPNVRRFSLRGLADARALEGEYVPSQGMDAQLKLFAKTLQDYGWKFKGRVLTTPKATVLSISNTGVVSTLEPFTVSTADKVRILNARDVSGTRQSGVYGVSVVTDSHTFTLRGYTGSEVTHAFVRLEDFNYFSVVGSSFSRGRVVNHKVGRDFFQFRGRRSKTA